jgi:hypothetical protein
VDDVVAAFQRLGDNDTEGHRREAIRTTFAAIEGVAWVYREHIRGAARDLDFLGPLTDLALQEKAYTISDKGDVIEQTRFVALPTMIRLTTRIAEQTFSGFKADFGHVGWACLKKAIAVRNRLMHPKTRADLLITDKEVGTAKAGFFWLLALVVEGMGAANAALVTFNDEARTLVQALKDGDESALAEYRQVQLTLDNS